MKEEKNTGRKAGGNADMPFDTDDFIQSVSHAGRNGDAHIFSLLTRAYR